MKLTICLVLSILGISLSNCQTEAPAKLLEHKVRMAKKGVQNPPLLILLHGLGSNENDLFQLANLLDENFLIVSARAPYVVSTDKFKWYDVDFSSGRPVINDAQAEESRKRLKGFVDQLKSVYSFDQEKIFIGGFSQGAIMSYSIGLTEPDYFAGIIALGGRMLDATKSKIAESKLASSNVLIIHGTKDKVLPVQYARQAKSVLEQQQVNLEYHEIDLGHSINRETLQLLNNWLARFRR
ncbi:MAG: dienelactone hydrolase family protein [Bacteroidota bacterium]